MAGPRPARGDKRERERGRERERDELDEKKYRRGR
jgi:hypothetical protein